MELRAVDWKMLIAPFNPIDVDFCLRKSYLPCKQSLDTDVIWRKA